MLWTALTLLGLAIASWRLTQNHPDDVGRFLGSLSALTCLIAGLATAPLFLRSIALLGLLAYPTCFPPVDSPQNPTCTRLCLFRSQCRPAPQGQGIQGKRF